MSSTKPDAVADQKPFTPTFGSRDQQNRHQHKNAPHSKLVPNNCSKRKLGQMIQPGYDNDDSLYLALSKGKGLGLWCSTTIEKNDIIGQYPGIAIDFNTFEAKRRKFHASPASDGMSKAEQESHLSEVSI